MPAGWFEAAYWPPGEPAAGEPASNLAWHGPQSWEHAPPAQDGSVYAQPAGFGAHDAHAYWGGEAPGWPEPQQQAYAADAASAQSPVPLPFLLSLAPIPAGWSGRPVRLQEPAARPTQHVAEPGGVSRDVMSKLLASLAVAPEIKSQPPPEPPVTTQAARRDSSAAAAAPQEASCISVAPQLGAASEPLLPGPAAPQPMSEFEIRPAAWLAPAPPQELSDDSSDAGTSSDGADNLRDAPAAGAPTHYPFGSSHAHVLRRPSDASERIADMAPLRGEVGALSAAASVQPAGEASKAPISVVDSSGGVASAPPLALPMPRQPYSVPSLPPAIPAPPLPPIADAGQQFGLGALLAARRETETVRAALACWFCFSLTMLLQAARAAAAQRREFTTADFRQLFSYCRHGKYRQAKDLLRGGCPVDGRDQFGNTPLIIACQNGHARLAKALLRHGAVIDAANKSGNTGLHYAVSFGFSPLADFLISQGADDKVRNAVGLTPYEGIK